MRVTNFLVTGPPRCGKSTLIEAVVAKMEVPVTGFFTREIKEKGRRRGFAIVTLEGRVGILAHDGIKSKIWVGKYGVSLEDLETIAVPSMISSRPGEIVVIDEIGKMECYSLSFRDTLLRALDCPNKVIGSIALKGGSFLQAIKSRPDVRLIPISEQNRDALAQSLPYELVAD